MKNENDPEKDRLTFENELKKLKLKAEKGAEFFSGEGKIPAEIESQWLDHIMAFEKASEHPETRKIKDILNNPDLPSPENLKDGELSAALEKVLDLLAKNNMALDVIYEVPEQEVYRFIYEELLEHEIQVINVPGMVTHLTYEEFHPNDEEDLKRYATEFLEMLGKKSFEFIDATLSSEITHQGETIPSKQFAEWLSRHFDTLEVHFEEIQITSVQINEDKAVVKCQLSYQKANKTSAVSTHITDEATFDFVHTLGFWYIGCVSIPGLRL